MQFNSISYVAFLIGVIALTWALRRRPGGRNAVLLGASWCFYAAWDWRFLSLLLLTSVMDYAIGRKLGNVSPERVAVRKAWLAVSVVVNLSVLGFFKYFGFFTESAVALLQAFGLTATVPLLKVVLPVGISFFIFQSMSYVVDVYRGRLSPEPSFRDYALYVSFFPQLVAGPIERATHLLPQFKRVSLPTWDMLSSGVWLIGMGLFKKVVLADNVAKVANAVFGVTAVPDGLDALLGIYAFALQIYCDFSAYSDIARGSARCMGFDLMLNFDRPYFAKNPSEFWRRWHISLSTWLRDYLYIGLGGNRGGQGRTYRNLMLTMLLGGLWHGAAWPFVLWGLYHGVLLCGHRLLVQAVGGRFRVGGLGMARCWSLCRILGFFHLTCLGWLLFRCDTLGQIGRMLYGLFGLADGVSVLDGSLILILVTTAGLLLAGQLFEVAVSRQSDSAIFRLPVLPRAAVYTFMAVVFVLYGEFDGQAFIYFQF